MTLASLAHPSAVPRMHLGIDLGGTKIEIAVLDDARRFLLRQRCATPQGDYAGTLAAMAQLVHAAEQTLGIGGQRLPVGIGIPGSLSPRNGQVRNANSTALNGQALLHDVQRLLPGRAVHIANDANCLALSEARDGAGAGMPVVFAAILGTGVGAGIAINGQVINGRNGVAGEWGHNPLPPSTQHGDADGLCWCGRTHCNETGLSGPGFAADHLRHTGENLLPQAIIEAMRAGNAAAQDSFARYTERLARALAQVIHVLDPDVIVLGGGMSNVTELYAAVPALWSPYVFSDTVSTLLRPALHGDSSGVRGAAFLGAPQ